MGERLVVSVKRRNEVFAAIYYHWSAYSLPAINILDSLNTHVLSQITDDMSNDDVLLKIIRFAEKSTSLGYFETEQEAEAARAKVHFPKGQQDSKLSELVHDLFGTHGGVYRNDREFIQAKFPNEVFLEKDVSRNEGLVAAQHQSISSCLEHAVAEVEIDLDSGTVLDSAYSFYSIDEYLDETSDDESAELPDEIEKLPLDITNFSLSEIPLVKEIITHSQSEYLRFKDDIFQLICG